MNSQVRKVNGFHLATLALLCTAFTPPAWAELGMGKGLGIVASVHNFAPGGNPDPAGMNTTGEICRVCHVPHDHARASQRYLNGLLWNHQLSSATYTMYSNAWSKTLTGSQAAQPDGTAKLCLGCHDGTVALDAFDKYVGDEILTMRLTEGHAVVTWMSDGANIDLRGTHPISVAFPAGETGDGKNFTNPATATWSRGQTVAATLDNGKVQCSTCHDVHDQESIPGTALLRTAQSPDEGGVPSGLCLTCHVK